MSESAPQPRVIVGRFVVTHELTTRGGSRAYRCADSQSGRSVVVREFEPADGAAADAVLAALQQTARVSSRFVAPLVAAGALVPGTLYAAHASLAGESLAARLARKRSLPLRDAAAVVVRVVRGLVALHERGLVHGGVRPTRVFHAQAAQGWHVQLLSACVPSVSRAQARADPSLARFAPPEWLAGEAWTAAGDVWCAGALLVACLAPEAPPVDETARGQLLATAGATEPLRALVEAMLAPEPLARPSAARELVAQLRELVPEPDAPPERSRRTASAWTAGGILGRHDDGSSGEYEAEAGARARRPRRWVGQVVLALAAGSAVALGLVVLAARRRETELLAQLRASEARDAARGLGDAGAGAARPAGGAEATTQAGDASGHDGAAGAAGATRAPSSGEATTAGNGAHAREPAARVTTAGAAATMPARDADASDSPGVLELRVTEPCALTIDGSPRGAASGTRMTLAAGTHAVRCRSAAHDVGIPVVIHAGSVTRIEIDAAGATHVRSADSATDTSPR